MELNDIYMMMLLLLVVMLFIKANTKRYSYLREAEAERYFNGSIVDSNELYKERTYTHGLALVKDKTTNTYKFKKQAKMCDTALLYS